jgi:hypothetical protein
VGHPAHPHHPHHHHYRHWWDRQHGQVHMQMPWYVGPSWHVPYERGTPMAYRRSPYGPVVQDEHPTHQREFPIGFSAVGVDAIPPGTQSEIDQKPQVLFRGERLAVPASIVGNFDFNDIKVGKDSQLAAAGIMPTECFSNLSVGVTMQLDTAEPGILVSLFVTNNAGQGQEFRSVLYGTVIE